MIGLDTNVLVRYIMQDDRKQAALASRMVESSTPENPGFVAIVTVVELYWVLGTSYGLTRAQLVSVLDGIVRSRQLVVERSEQVVAALRAYGAGSAGFPDCLITRASVAAGCDAVMTFDVAASRHAGMTLLA